MHSCPAACIEYFVVIRPLPPKEGAWEGRAAVDRLPDIQSGADQIVSQSLYPCTMRRIMHCFPLDPRISPAGPGKIPDEGRMICSRDIRAKNVEKSDDGKRWRLNAFLLLCSHGPSAQKDQRDTTRKTPAGHRVVSRRHIGQDRYRPPSHERKPLYIVDRNTGTGSPHSPFP